jgi:hypothetical protein
MARLDPRDVSPVIKDRLDSGYYSTFPVKVHIIEQQQPAA